MICLAPCDCTHSPKVTQPSHTRTHFELLNRLPKCVIRAWSSRFSTVFMVMLWCVCVSYFSFSLFGLLRRVVSSTLSCFSYPRGLGLNNWVVLRPGNKLHCRCNNLLDNVCECVSECVRLMLPVRGNDCYYSRAWEADACCLRNQTCYVSMCVLVLSVCRLQERRYTICFVTWCVMSQAGRKSVLVSKFKSRCSS